MALDEVLAISLGENIVMIDENNLLSVIVFDHRGIINLQTGSVSALKSLRCGLNFFDNRIHKWLI